MQEQDENAGTREDFENIQEKNHLLVQGRIRTGTDTAAHGGGDLPF